tara:strand:- start:1463 stop:1810 length:348 start_codon:yes stop_codon:yes gene_type:complete
MKLHVYRQQTLLLTRVRHADNFATRLRGLLLSRPLQPDEGLLLSPCRQVHTIGMRMALDVIFLDEDGQIIRCVPHLPPWRIAGNRHAQRVLEIHSGGIERLGLQAGQHLHWQAPA